MVQTISECGLSVKDVCDANSLPGSIAEGNPVCTEGVAAV